MYAQERLRVAAIWRAFFPATKLPEASRCGRDAAETNPLVGQDERGRASPAKIA